MIVNIACWQNNGAQKHVHRAAKRGTPGIELGTSCTRSKNHTTRPCSQVGEGRRGLIAGRHFCHLCTQKCKAQSLQLNLLPCMLLSRPCEAVNVILQLCCGNRTVRRNATNYTPLLRRWVSPGSPLSRRLTANDGETCIFGEHTGEGTGFAVAEQIRHAFTSYSCPENAKCRIR